MLRPNVEDLSCLNAWPEDAEQYDQDQQLISQLLALCDQHGSPRVAQVAAAMDEIWINPHRLHHFQTVREARFGTSMPSAR